VGADDRLWAIDHGVCFHTEYKLRTVIWEFSGEPIEPELAAELEELARAVEDDQSELARILCHLLSPAERSALTSRVRNLLRSCAFPTPSHHRRNYPWPPV
jgi:uncharacterized repeat protein (TIGR03843 family)